MKSAIAIITAAVLCTVASADVLPAISKTEMQLELSQRVGRGLYEYTYAIVQENQGDDALNVMGMVTSSASNIEVIDGQFGVGDMPSASLRTSDDTTVLQIDRSSPFYPQSLTFSYTGGPPGVEGPPTDDYEEAASYGALSTSTDLYTFQSVNGSFALDVSGAYFASEAYQITASLNGDLVESFSLSPTQIVFQNLFVSGENHVVFYGNDDVGSSMYFDAIFWAGSHSISFSVVDGNGTPVMADVTFKLSDNPKVTKTVHYEGVTLLVTDFPARTIIVEAQGEDGQYGSTAFIAGSQTSAVIVVKGIDAPAPNSNLDFQNGTVGWVVSGSGTIAVQP